MIQTDAVQFHCEFFSSALGLTVEPQKQNSNRASNSVYAPEVTSLRSRHKGNAVQSMGLWAGCFLSESNVSDVDFDRDFPS